MHLYLIRHAHALDGEDDHARALSNRGWKQIRTLADFLRATEAMPVSALWHSPLVRARETAEGLARGLKLSAQLRETTGLRSEDDPRLVAARIEALHAPVAIIGHEPHLSGLVSLLVSGAIEPPVIVMKKCAAVRLDRLDHGWAVRWHVSPELLG
ncbi:MAG TPA: phosphohistidine phosphatase SixA [Opitutus sp.]|nr:phosphohistidine phosphatase SixA [Opitutus sp.]